MFRNKILHRSFFIFKKNNGLISFSKIGNLSHCYVRNFSQNFLFFQNVLLIKNIEAINYLKIFYLKRNLPKIKSNEKYMSNTPQRVCWKCNKPLYSKKFTCSSCHVLQPPNPNVNYFELLGVTQTYEVDLDNLNQKYKKLQIIFHPDKVANKSKEEIEISETYSRVINKAYSTLKDPINRGFYLLQILEIPTDSNTPLDQNFLSFIMEKNEELETIDNLTSLNKLLKENDEELKKQHFEVQNAFQSNNLNNANQSLVKLNYLMNLAEKIKEKELKIKSNDSS